ncbi:hypothetical protein CEK25_012168 [Fusarium fujikuroi]|nr:hypothetical protein CEK25_012168 [Fusarium fujikuroi]
MSIRNLLSYTRGWATQECEFKEDTPEILAPTVFKYRSQTSLYKDSSAIRKHMLQEYSSLLFRKNCCGNMGDSKRLLWTRLEKPIEPEPETIRGYTQIDFPTW